MATGLKILRAISEKRRGWPPNAEFKICAVDALSLLTLFTRDLLREKFRGIVAEEVIAGLKNGDIALLGARLGVRFVYSDEALPLVVEQPKAEKAKRKKPAKRKISKRTAKTRLAAKRSNRRKAPSHRKRS